MSKAPLSPEQAHARRLSWTVYSFLAFCFVGTAVLIWQLWGMTPANWCYVEKVNDPAGPFACIQQLLTNKDHVNIGLLGIFALGYICHAVVVLKLAVKAEIPGGGSIDITGDHQSDPE